MLERLSAFFLFFKRGSIWVSDRETLRCTVLRRTFMGYRRKCKHLNVLENASKVLQR